MALLCLRLVELTYTLAHTVISVSLESIGSIVLNQSLSSVKLNLSRSVNPVSKRKLTMLGDLTNKSETELLELFKSIMDRRGPLTAFDLTEIDQITAELRRRTREVELQTIRAQAAKKVKGAG